MKTVLIVSYYSNNVSLVMSQWVTDKIGAFQKNNYKIILLSSTVDPKLNNTKDLKNFRVPSLSPTFFFRELITDFKSNFFIHLIFFPFVLTIGLCLEITERIILKRLGDGYWSWTFSSLFGLIFLLGTNKLDIILSTGGPASAHLSTTIAGKMFRKKIINELQDPLNGDDIGHNGKSRGYLLKLEKFLINNSNKIVFVTKNAFLSAQKRYEFKNNLSYSYTSSRNFNVVLKNNINYLSLKLIHLGTIYSTRNFKNLITALEDITKNSNPKINFSITNIGEIKGEENLEKPSLVEFVNQNSMNRIDGLRYLKNYDVLLLIQHTDERSKLTIPYKTWDYLNSGKIILGLVNNNELKKILEEHGHFTADNKDVEAIKNTIYNLLHCIIHNKLDIKLNKYDINEQVNDLISF